MNTPILLQPATPALAAPGRVADPRGEIRTGAIIAALFFVALFIGITVLDTKEYHPNYQPPPVNAARQNTRVCGMTR
mgnify:CR=1 FL=1